MKIERWKLACVVGCLLIGGSYAEAQLSDEIIAGRDATIAFLEAAEVIDADKMPASEGVTEPYKLTLQLDGRSEFALWKNPQGRVQGYVEGWKYEIAAYELDKYLGTNMVPPTAMKRYKGSQGSCQVWVDHWINMDKMIIDNLNPTGGDVRNFNRAVFLQRAFDNLIANEDRHLRNILLTEDWKMILIDHSRSFRYSKKHQKKLIFTERHPEGPKLMRQLPKEFVSRVEAIDLEKLNELVGEWLTEAEIAAVLARKELILTEVARLVKENGESATLY
jgi:hypothetical protein